MRNPLILTGDNNIPALPMTEAQVNHLRRLLAWLRCAYMLDEHMQRGFIEGAALSVQHGAATPERAGEILQQQADKINQVPAYVRQAHKMLSKALLEHDKRSGVVEGCRSDENLQAMPVSEKPAGALISIRTALLHKSSGGRATPTPRRIYATATVWGVPSSVN